MNEARAEARPAHCACRAMSQVPSALLCALDTNTAVTSLLTACSSNCVALDAGNSIRTERRKAHDVLHAIPETDTPFGRVCCTSKVEGKNGSISLYHTNPKAMLYLALTTSPKYLAFLKDCVNRSPSFVLRLGLFSGSS